MSPTFMSCIDTALQKISDDELRRMWKAIYLTHPPRFNKELYIQHMSSRLSNLDFPIGSTYITHWLSEVYRLYYEGTKNTKPATPQSHSLIEMADSLSQNLRRGRRQL